MAFLNTEAQEAQDNVRLSLKAGVSSDQVSSEQEAYQEEEYQDAKAIVDDLPTEETTKEALIPASREISNIRNRFKAVRDSIQGTDVRRELNDLSYKGLVNFDNLTTEEKRQAYELRIKLSELQDMSEYELSDMEEFALPIGSSIYNFFRGIYEESGTIGKGAGIGAGTGAAVGLAAGGPLGAATIGIAGGVLGAKVGVLGAVVKDTFKQTSGELYRDLVNYGLSGSSQETKEHRRALSIGAGVLVTSTFSVFPLANYVKKAPWLKSLRNTKSMTALLSTNAAFRKWSLRLGLKILGKANLKKVSAVGGIALGSQAISEGVEEAIQETITTLTKLKGETWDGSQSSLLEALGNVEGSHIKDVALSGAAGLVGGKIFDVGSKLINPVVQIGEDSLGRVQSNLAQRIITKKELQDFQKTFEELKKNPVNPIPETKEIAEASDLQPVKPKTSDKEYQTELYKHKDKLSSEEFNEYLNASQRSLSLTRALRDIFKNYITLKDQHVERINPDFHGRVLDMEATGSYGNPILYFSSTELDNLSQDLKAFGAQEHVSQFLADHALEGDMALEDDGSQSLEPKMVKIRLSNVVKLMEIDERFAALAKEKAAHPSVNEFNFMAREVDKQINEKGEVKREPETLKILSNLTRSFNLFSAETSDITKIISRNKSFNVPKILNKEIDLSLGQQNRLYEKTAQENKAIHHFETRPNLKINPLTIPDDLKPIVKSIQKKERDFFSGKDGVDINVLSGDLNLNVSDLLNLLNGETFKVSNERRDDFKRKSEKLFFEGSRNPENSNLVKQYNRVSRIYAKDAGLVLEQSRKAQEAVLNKKIDELDPEYHSAEFKLSKDPIVKSRHLQLSKWDHVYIKALNNAKDWLVNLTSKPLQETISKLGTKKDLILYMDAIQELSTRLYQLLEPESKNNPEALLRFQDEAFDGPLEDNRAYDRFKIDMLLKGVFFPPLTELNLTDTTVKGALNIASILKNIAFRTKNDPFVRPPLRFRTFEFAVEEYEGKRVNDLGLEGLELSKQHPFYKTSRFGEGGVVDKSLSEKLLDISKNLYSSTKNMGFIFEKLDNFKPNGFFTNLFYTRIQGVGPFKGSGLTRYSNIQKDIRSIWNKGVAAYGNREFSRLGATRVSRATREILKPYARLNNGKLTKRDMLVILMNMGTQTNKDRVSLFGVDPDFLLGLIKTELKKKDFDFVQNTVWRIFKKYRPALEKLEMKTRGKELELREDLPFKAFGKDYKGGYFPISLKRLRTKKGHIDDLINGSHLSYLTGPKTVLAPHVIETVKELNAMDYHLNLDDFDEGMDKLAYDLAMRQPIEESLRLISNANMEKAIVNVVGRQDYNTILGTLELMTRKTSPEVRRVYHEAQNFISFAVGNLSRSVVLSSLVLNPKTILISFAPIVEISGKMGHVNGTKYLLPKLLHLANPTSFFASNLLEAASEVDPSIGKYLQGSDEYNRRAFDEFRPPKRHLKGALGRMYNWVPTYHEKLNEFSLSRVLGGIDARLKAIGILALKEQYLNGDVEGVTLQALSKMSKAAKESNANAYANDIISKTTMESHISDKAPVQNDPRGKLFTFFYNELRNIINNRILSVEKSYSKVTESLKAFQNGDRDLANGLLLGAAETMGSAYMTSVLALLYISFSQLKDPLDIPYDEEEDPEDPYDLNISRVIRRMESLSPFNPKGLTEVGLSVGSNMYGIRDILWSVESGRPPGIPLIKGVEFITKGVGTVYDISQITMTELMDGGGMYEVQDQLNRTDFVNLLNAAGVLWGGRGFPTRGFFRIKDALEQDDSYLLQTPDISSKYIKFVQNFMKNNPDSLYNFPLKDKALDRVSGEESFDRTPQSRAIYVDMMNERDVGDTLDIFNYSVTPSGHHFDTLTNSIIDIGLDYGFNFSMPESKLREISAVKFGNLTIIDQDNHIDLVVKNAIDNFRDNGIEATDKNLLYAVAFGADKYIEYKKGAIPFEKLKENASQWIKAHLPDIKSIEALDRFYKELVGLQDEEPEKINVDFDVKRMASMAYLTNPLAPKIAGEIDSKDLDFIERLAFLETGGGLKSKNVFKFSDEKWNDIKGQIAKSHGIELGAQDTVSNQYVAASFLTKQYKDQLTSAGIPISNMSLYFSHMFGSDAVKKFGKEWFFSASNKSLSAIVTPQGESVEGLIIDVPELDIADNLTVGDLKNYMLKKLTRKDRFLSFVKYQNEDTGVFKHDYIRGHKGNTWQRLDVPNTRLDILNLRRTSPNEARDKLLFDLVRKYPNYPEYMDVIRNIKEQPIMDLTKKAKKAVDFLDSNDLPILEEGLFLLNEFGPKKAIEEYKKLIGGKGYEPNLFAKYNLNDTKYFERIKEGYEFKGTTIDYKSIQDDLERRDGMIYFEGRDRSLEYKKINDFLVLRKQIPELPHFEKRLSTLGDEELNLVLLAAEGLRTQDPLQLLDQIKAIKDKFINTTYSAEMNKEFKRIRLKDTHDAYADAKVLNNLSRNVNTYRIGIMSGELDPKNEVKRFGEGTGEGYYPPPPNDTFNPYVYGTLFYHLMGGKFVSKDSLLFEDDKNIQHEQQLTEFFHVGKAAHNFLYTENIVDSYENVTLLHLFFAHTEVEKLYFDVRSEYIVPGKVMLQKEPIPKPILESDGYKELLKIPGFKGIMEKHNHSIGALKTYIYLNIQEVFGINVRHAGE